jgi:hypothetical protein
MEAATQVVRRNINPIRRFGVNALIYLVTIITVGVFIYFIYRYITGSSTLKQNVVLADKVTANDASSPKNNIKLPDGIYDGGEFTLNFWIYISGYNYRQGSRKHLIEIYSAADTFSTILVALGAFKPTLMVRAHTIASDGLSPGGNHKWGVTDCSGGNDDCSGGDMNGFSKLTDTNYTPQNNVNDNSLYRTDRNQFFKPMQVDEPSSTCDVKDIPLQKWVNVCITMSGKTLDVYLDGKLVKTCVYKNFFKVDSANGVAIRFLQGVTTQVNGRDTTLNGYDGYFSRLQVFNSALNPDEIYKTYMAGPTGSSPANDPVSFIKYIFTG